MSEQQRLFGKGKSLLVRSAGGESKTFGADTVCVSHSRHVFVGSMRVLAVERDVFVALT